MIIFIKNGQYLYYKTNITKEWLRKNGFHYSKEYSGETEVYIKRIPLHKYKKETTIEGEIAIEYESGNTTVNVLVAKTQSLYHPYYNTFCGNQESSLFYEIDKNILNELRNLGIIRKRVNKRKWKK